VARPEDPPWRCLKRCSLGAAETTWGGAVALAEVSAVEGVPGDPAGLPPGSPGGDGIGPDVARPRWVRLVLAGGWLAGGVIVAVLGLTVLGDAPMGLRVAAVVAGVVAAYRGVQSAGRAVAGDGWDAALWLSVVWIGVLVAAAVAAPLLPLGEHRDTAATIAEPSLLRPDLGSEHPLGTNNLGLDQLARVVYGARASLLMALVASAIGLVVGGAVGVVAGTRRGWVDRALGVANNAFLAFPPLVLLLAFAAVMERDARNIALALGALSIPVNLRLARANAMAVAQEGFVEAARVMGASRRRIVLREIVPNVLPALLSYALIVMAVLLVAEASLSYLGLGVQQPDPSWGNMMAEGDGGLLEEHPHLVVVPGGVMFATVLAFNLVGERLRQRWDSRGS
jgi:peptide/nickel transport system permease protein